MDYHKDCQNLITCAQEYTRYEPQESVETPVKELDCAQQNISEMTTNFGALLIWTQKTEGW